MQGTKDRPTAGVEQAPSGVRRPLLAGGVALAVLAAGGAAVLAGTDLGREPQREQVSSRAPAAPAPLDTEADGSVVDAPAPAGEAPVADTPAGEPPAGDPPAGEAPRQEPPDVAPAEAGSDADGQASADAPASGAVDAVPAGSHDVRVLGEGWDARGRFVLVDRGRLTDGPPAEPGVDGTRPVLFDTGAVAERRRIDLAEQYSLTFARTGGEPSYGPGGWDDFVTEVSGREVLATIEVDGSGRLASLEEPYRP